MTANENASRRRSRPAKRRAETIAAEQLIPRLNCITAVGGVQVARRHPYTKRLFMYEEAKREFRSESCSYESFIHAIVEALQI